jgi:hypothetical protein
MNDVTSSNIIAVSTSGIQVLPYRPERDDAPRGSPARRIHAPATERGTALCGTAAGAGISRRSALRQMTLAGLALGLGVRSAKAGCSLGFPPNNALGTFIEAVGGTWYTCCTDNGGGACTNPNWKNLNATNGTYVNNNYSGNNAGFATNLGGVSEMVVYGLPMDVGAIYKLTYNQEMLNSTSPNDDTLEFIVDQTNIIDRIHPSLGRSDRTVIVIPSPTTNLTWRFTKVATTSTNGVVRFRVDNLRVVKLPPPVLQYQRVSGNPFGDMLLMWPIDYGNELMGTSLRESDLPDAVLWTPVSGASYSDATRFGKYVPTTGLAKYYRLVVAGTPAL